MLVQEKQGAFILEQSDIDGSVGNVPFDLSIVLEHNSSGSLLLYWLVVGEIQSFPLF